MPERSRVELDGWDDAGRDVHRWADELGEIIDRETGGLAGQIVSMVAGRVPVLTGALAASVDVEAGPDWWGVSIGDGLDYAGWIEFGGSSGRPAMPEGRYLYPTAREHEDDYLRQAEAAAERSVGRFPWSKAT